MEPATFFEGFRCLDCGREAAFGTAVCPDCAGALESVYDDRALDHQGTEPEPPTILPPARRLDIGAAGTPTLRLPGLTDETAAGTVLLKLEGQTGTGSIVDRGMGTAVAVAAARGIDRLTLPSTGAGARSAAAYAARADADIDLEAIVPSRTAFANKAMSNAYGADLTVVGGRYTDARTAFEDRTADRGQTTWRSLAPFETPYRRDGLRAIAYELVGALGAAPDAVVVPTGHGTAVVGIDRGFRELLAAGLIAASPRLYATQAAGCAPLAAATGGVPATVEQPDTVHGPVEVPNPAGGSYALRVLERTRGAAVAVTDEESLAAATSLTARGVPVSATGGVGVAAVEEIAVAPDETAVVIDPVGPDREADLLRSYLTGAGR